MPPYPAWVRPSSSRGFHPLSSSSDEEEEIPHLIGELDDDEEDEEDATREAASSSIRDYYDFERGEDDSSSAECYNWTPPCRKLRCRRGKKTRLRLPEFFHVKSYNPGRFRQQVTIAPALHGDVRSVYDTCTNQKVVMKVVTKEAVHERRENDLESPFVEICVMNYLQSKRACPRPLFIASTVGTYRDQKYFYLVQEHCEMGELYTLLRGEKRLPEPRVKKIALQLLFALISLHMNGLCHRDVSLENVLVMHDDSIRLIDFGQADTLTDQAGNPRLLLGPAGKAYYRAPEVYIGPYFGAPVDVFGWGVLMFLLVTGSPPWMEATHSDERYQVISSSPQGLSRAFARWRWRRPSPELEDLLQSIFFNPAAVRPTVHDIVKHPWFADDPAPWQECLRVHPGSDLIIEMYQQTRLYQRQMIHSMSGGGGGIISSCSSIRPPRSKQQYRRESGRRSREYSNRRPPPPTRAERNNDVGTNQTTSHHSFSRY